MAYKRNRHHAAEKEHDADAALPPSPVQRAIAAYGPLGKRDVDHERLGQAQSFLRPPSPPSRRIEAPVVPPLSRIPRPEQSRPIESVARAAIQQDRVEQAASHVHFRPAPVSAVPELSERPFILPLPLPPPIRPAPPSAPASSTFDSMAMANQLTREADRETSQRGLQDEARLSAAFAKHVEPLFRGHAPAANRPDGLTGQEREGLRTTARIAARAIGRDVLAGLVMDTMRQSPAPFEVQIDATEIRDEQNFRSIVSRIARTTPTVQARLNNGAMERIDGNSDAFVNFALANRETLSVIFPRSGDRSRDVALAKSAVELAENSGGTLLCRVDDNVQPVIAPRAIRADIEEALVGITDPGNSAVRDEARENLGAMLRSLRTLQPTGELSPSARSLVDAGVANNGHIFDPNAVTAPVAQGFCRLYELGIPLERME